MTGDVNERTTLSSYRFVAAMIAQLVVGAFTLSLVDKLGHGDNARGWQMTIGLWAIICVVFFVITFLTTRERILPTQSKKWTLARTSEILLKNGPWIAMFILTLSHFIFVAMRGGAMYYYFKYYISETRLFEVLAGLGLTNIADGSGGPFYQNPGRIWSYC